MEQYIREQLLKITPDTPWKDRVHIFDNMYALLEEEGNDRKDIKLMIDAIIINKIHDLSKKGLDSIE